jgi:hypothetical protein
MGKSGHGDVTHGGGHALQGVGGPKNFPHSFGMSRIFFQRHQGIIQRREVIMRFGEKKFFVILGVQISPSPIWNTGLFRFGRCGFTAKEIQGILKKSLVVFYFKGKA